MRGLVSVKSTLISTFAFLGIVGIVSIVLLYNSFSSYDNEVNVAGRNRMLSQRIALFANLHMEGNGNAESICREAMILHEESLTALETGGKAPGVTEDVQLSPAEGIVKEQIAETRKIWETFKGNVDIILNEGTTLDDGSTNPSVQSALDYINSNASLLLRSNDKLVNAYERLASNESQKTAFILVVALAVSILTVVGSIIHTKNTIADPLQYFSNRLTDLANGNYHQEVKFKGYKEFEQLADKLKILLSKLNELSIFIESIGKGNLNYQVSEEKRQLIGNDGIFISLQATQQELLRVEEENKIRQWSNEGVRIVSEILQRRYENAQDLYDQLTATIVKYIDANQGAIFTINEERDTPFLEMSGCYAYERKKFQNMEIDIEEGLLGQAYKEKSLMVLTEVPHEFVNITSGLGKSTPNCVVVLPLKDNEKVVGVLELASFEKLAQHRIDFLEKISEMIASSLNSIKINEQTKRLLSESQQQTEEMRAQEEEMRQNMEELQATQEEMARKERENNRLLEESATREREVKEKEQFLDNLINASSDLILAIDREYKVVNFNKAMKKNYENVGVSLKKGMSIMETFPNEEMKNQFKSRFDKAFNGEYLKSTIEIPMDSGTVYYLVNDAPLKNEKGEIVAVVSYSKDITELVNSQKKSEKLLTEAQQQSEELKAQEEELKQNMEEMQSIQEELEKRAEETEKANKELELENAMFTGLMDVLNDRITIKDTEGKYLRLNKTKEVSLIEQGIKDYKGKSDADIFDQEHFDKSFKVEKKIMETKKGTYDDENKITNPDGKVWWASTTRVPFMNKSGAVMGTIVVTRNVTREKVCEENLAEANKEISKLKKSK